VIFKKTVMGMMLNFCSDWSTTWNLVGVPLIVP